MTIYSLKFSDWPLNILQPGLDITEDIHILSKNNENILNIRVLVARIFYFPSNTPMHCSLCWEFSINMLNNKRTQCPPYHRLLYAIKYKALLSSLVTKIIYNFISLLKSSDVETWNICLVERKRNKSCLEPQCEFSLSPWLGRWFILAL